MSLIRNLNFGQWLNAFTKDNGSNLYGFHGGLALETNKRALVRENAQTPAHNNGQSNKWANEQTITELALPEQLVIPLVDYHGNELTALVEINQRIERGQQIAANIVSPTNGIVSAIEQRKLIHPGDLSANAVVINCDNQYGVGSVTQGNLIASSTDRAISRFIANPSEALNNAALVGLGGAAYPTQHKLQAAPEGIKTLIINAAECEPEIACDEALMQNDPSAIAYGVEALVQLTQCKQCIVAIEDSKPIAIEALRNALEVHSANITLQVIATRYPTGAESPLIETLTGIRIPHGTPPGKKGILCVNVGTVYALWQSIFHGLPLDSRVVSLGGSQMRNPCNVRVRFGTPVSFILEATNNAPLTTTTRIRAGGPLSGFDLDSLDVPITAKTNCILAEPEADETPEQACIRCGQCADVCPSRLLPQQLHWYAQEANHDKCAELNLNACIECGCCDLVCPSSIKLTQTFRYAKSKARFLSEEHRKAEAAELRYTEREQRLEKREVARQAAIEARKQSLKKPSQPDSERIKDALNRARSKRRASKE